MTTVQVTSAEIRQLDAQEIDQTSGGMAPFIAVMVGAAAGYASYHGGKAANKAIARWLYH